jgi:long-chain fatty acid transport protein
MPKAHPLPCAAALGLLLAGTPAQAQIGLSLNRAGSGARAAGMADAFIAVSDDGTAASWNPAGLAQLRQPEFSFVYVVSAHGLDLSGMRSLDETVAFATPAYGFTNASIDFASAAVPFSVAKKPATVQVGWHRLYQLSSDVTGTIGRVPLEPPGPTAVLWRSSIVDGDIDVLTVAGAVKLTSRLAIGGSADFWRGNWTDRLSLIEPAPSDGVASSIVVAQDVKMRGTTFSGGILLTYPAFNVGLVYHAPFWADLHVGSVVLPPDAPAQQAAADLGFRLPRSIGAGVAVRLGPRWTAAAAVTQDQWKDALLRGAPGSEGPVSFFDGAPPELSTTRDTVSLNVGVEHLLVREGSVVPLRLGVGWEPQGGMDSLARDPVNYLLVAAGGGYNTNRFKFDAAVQYRRGTFRMTEVYSVQQAAVEGRDGLGLATADEWRIKVSAIYRLADTDTLKKGLRKIFG